MNALLDVLDERNARKRRRRFATAAGVVAASAITLYAASARPAEHHAGPIRPAELNATAWHVNFGEMRIHVDDDGRFVGVYDQGNGVLVGHYANDRFVGWWCQEPTRRAPDDAGRVQLHFVRGDDRILIEGMWTYGDARMAAWQDNFYGVSLRTPASYKLEQRLQHHEQCPGH
jgi:hypothetical protein